MRELSKAEETLLLTILRLKDNAYGVAIKLHIQKTTGKSLPYGTLYFILEQLTKKGFSRRPKANPDQKEEAEAGSITLSLPMETRHLSMLIRHSKKYGMGMQSWPVWRRLLNEKNKSSETR